MRTLILVGILVVMSGCGSKSSSGETVKSLWSQWHSSATNLTINLQGGQIGVSQPFTFNLNGPICTCSALMTGTETSGNYSLSSCTYTSGGSGDPGCAALNKTGTYSKTATELTFCDPTCATYQ